MLFGVYYNLVRKGDNFYRKGCEMLEKGCDDTEYSVMFTEALEWYRKTVSDSEDAASDTVVLTRLAMAAFHCKKYKLMWETVDKVVEISPRRRESYLLKAGLLFQMEYHPDAIRTLVFGIGQLGGDILLEECLNLIEDIQSCINSPLQCHHHERGWHANVIVHFLKNYTRQPNKAMSLARVLQSNDAAVYLSLMLRVNLLDPASSFSDVLCTEQRFSPLHFACWHGHYNEVVRLLSDFDTDIHEAGLFGLTPLHIACLRGHVDVVCALLRHGAEPSWSDPGLNVEDFVGETRRLFWDRVVHLDLTSSES